MPQQQSRADTLPLTQNGCLATYAMLGDTSPLLWQPPWE